MDVTSLGTRRRGIPPPAVTGGGAAPASPPEVHGIPVAPDLVLPSGVHVRVMRYGNRLLTQAALDQAIRAIQQLPVAHQQVIARAGVPIELIPVTDLETPVGTDEPMVGATTVDKVAGRWTPSRIRIAAASPRTGEFAIGEVVQHEIGHVISVIGSQDRSEDAARRYAAAY